MQLKKIEDYLKNQYRQQVEKRIKGYKQTEQKKKLNTPLIRQNTMNGGVNDMMFSIQTKKHGQDKTKSTTNVLNFSEKIQ